MTALHRLDATDQAALLRRGDVTSVELVQHHLDRVGALDSTLGAFITVTAERALQRAAEADKRLASGNGLHLLDGVPTAIKDLTPTTTEPTTYGSVVTKDFVSPVSAYSAELLEGAGLISLGKTNTPEFGLSSYTDNDLVGPARTPWNLDCNAGGSSGGAATSVAAGLVPLALGSDGGGSIRIPASSCGIFGLKPSRGRVSSGPTGNEVSGLAIQGPLSRSVRDAAALLDILARPMPGDPYPSTSHEHGFSACVGRDPGRLRIARWSTPYLSHITAHADTVAAYESATSLLESLGHEVEEIANPFPGELETHFNVIWSTGMAALPLRPETEKLLRANTAYWRKRGAQSTGTDLLSAMVAKELLIRQALTSMAPYDAFLTPTLALPPQRNDWFNESGDPFEDHQRELQYTPYTACYNMSGQPAASLPLYWNGDDLPIGVMLATKPGFDGLLISLCAEIEAAAPWQAKWPPIADND